MSEFPSFLMNETQARIEALRDRRKKMVEEMCEMDPGFGGFDFRTCLDELDELEREIETLLGEEPKPPT